MLCSLSCPQLCPTSLVSLLQNSFQKTESVQTFYKCFSTFFCDLPLHCGSHCPCQLQHSVGGDGQALLLPQLQSHHGKRSKSMGVARRSLQGLPASSAEMGAVGIFKASLLYPLQDPCTHPTHSLLQPLPPSHPLQFRNPAHADLRLKEDPTTLHIHLETPSETCGSLNTVHSDLRRNMSLQWDSKHLCEGSF